MSLETGADLERQPLLLCIKWSYQASHKIATCLGSKGAVPGISHRADSPWDTQDMQTTSYLTVGNAWGFLENCSVWGLYMPYVHHQRCSAVMPPIVYYINYDYVQMKLVTANGVIYIHYIYKGQLCSISFPQRWSVYGFLFLTGLAVWYLHCQ